LWQRESLLLPAALYLNAPSGEGEPGRMQAVQSLLARLNGLVFLDTQEVSVAAGFPGLAVEVGKPTPVEQQAAWSAALADLAGDSPAVLAGHFDLGLANIREIARQALAERQPEELHQGLWRGALAATRPRLDALAQRIEPRATWDDIVL